MNTERDDLAETLREIASGSRRSKIVRLREIFDDVESAKAKGATNKEIVVGLAKHGIIFDVPNFKNARSRILKERALEVLTLAAPAIIENKSTRPTRVLTNSVSAPSKVTRNPAISPTKQDGVVKDGGKTGEELVRPPGVTDAGWSEMKAKSRAEKRKQIT